MSFPSRAGYLVLAVAVHAGVLWGVHFGPPAFISSQEEPVEAIEVGLVESADFTPEPPAPGAPVPEPAPPEPPAPTPPPPKDAIPERIPTPEAPKPEAPRPKPKPIPRPPSAPRPSAPAATAPSTGGSRSGNPGPATAGKPGRGDAAHASWRNRVRPSYPAAARTAGHAGRVLIIVQVNALGRATGARIYQTSGFASLDQAALAAARASTYNPKKIAGVPLPDTITIPYTFRLEDR